MTACTGLGYNTALVASPNIASSSTVYINNPSDDRCAFSKEGEMRDPVTVASVDLLGVRDCPDGGREVRNKRLQSLLVGFLARSNQFQEVVKNIVLLLHEANL